jgi:hypothetical protein
VSFLAGAAIGLAAGVCSGLLAGMAMNWYLWHDATPEPKGIDFDDPANRERLDRWLRATAPDA